MRISDWSSDVCSSDLAGSVRRSRSNSRVAAPPSRWWTFVMTIPTHQAASCRRGTNRSEEHTSELQSLMRISYAVFCLKKKNKTQLNDCTTQPLQICRK